MPYLIYIPVTDATLAAIGQSSDALRLSPATLPACEALGLTALQALPLDADNPGGLIETALIRLFDLWNEHRLQPPEALKTFNNLLYEHLDFQRIKNRIPYMDRWRICTVPSSVVASRQFLTPRGEWDIDFKKTFMGDLYAAETVVGVHTLSPGYHYTESQYRILNRVSSNTEDHANIHGNAGTGKTHVIEGLLNVWENQGFKPANILIIVQQIAQVQSLKFRLSKSYHRQIITFGQFAARLLPEEYKHFCTHIAKDKTIDKHALVTRYGLQAQAGMSASEILTNIFSTVYNYCINTDEAIADHHLPKDLQSRAPGGYAENQILRGIVLTKARQLWLDLFDLTAKNPVPIPIRAYHQAKLAATLRCSIAPYIRCMVIDESHDLSAVMNQLIHSSPHVASVTLGDGFQNLKGTYVDLGKDIPTLDLGRSYRSGRALESLVKPIVRKHIFVPPEEYKGSMDVYTEINYYRTPHIPGKPSGILVSDLWALWVWVQDIADQKKPFTLLGSSHVLTNFAKAVIDLKAGRQTSHWALSKYPAWQHLASDLHSKNMAFRKIADWFDRGYEIKELHMALLRYYQESLFAGKKPTTHVIGLAEQSKNHEFDRIYLTPDIVSLVEGEKALSMVKASMKRSILYIAATRGKHEVSAPIELREWIEEVTGR